MEGRKLRRLRWSRPSKKDSLARWVVVVRLRPNDMPTSVGRCLAISAKLNAHNFIFCLHIGESRSAQPIQNGSSILKDFLARWVVVVRLRLKYIPPQWAGSLAISNKLNAQNFIFCLHIGESRSAQPIQNGSSILKDFLARWAGCRTAKTK